MQPVQDRYDRELREQGLTGWRRETAPAGIVHIGVGGFHRAHQACYQERLNRLDPDQAWSITGVSLLAGDVPLISALKTQNGLYTLTEADQSGESLTTIGTLTRLIAATETPDAAVQAMASPETRIISTTITEGGYLYDFEQDTFLSDHPQVRHDIASPETPEGLFGYLRKALHFRREQNAGPVTLMSCDNVPGNGDVFRASLLAFLEEADDRPLLAWVSSNVTFPNSMVDRITPKSPAELPEKVAHRYGVDDQCPVIAEPFTQWVLEDRFISGRPAWERVGAEFTTHVREFEQMKIRLLNGTHIMIAQAGYRLGITYIHELMAHPLIARLADRYMLDWAAPTIDGFGTEAITEYARMLQYRFANPAVRDSVERVATDGFSRLKNFLVPVVRFHLSAGRVPALLALPFACWLHKLQGQDEQGRPIALTEPALTAEEVAWFRNDPRAWLTGPTMFGAEPDELTEQFIARALALREALRGRSLEAVLREF